jgi:hypothetical protein
MLSDVLVEGLPRLVANAYPYLIEKRRFDYGDLGDRVKKKLAELIVLVDEVEFDWVRKLDADDRRRGDSKIARAFAKGDYQSVLDAYLPKCAKELKAFQRVFEMEMKGREEISRSGVTWLTPEVAKRAENLPVPSFILGMQSPAKPK